MSRLIDQAAMKRIIAVVIVAMGIAVAPTIGWALSIGFTLHPSNVTSAVPGSIIDLNVVVQNLTASPLSFATDPFSTDFVADIAGVPVVNPFTVADFEDAFRTGFSLAANGTSAPMDYGMLTLASFFSGAPSPDRSHLTIMAKALDPITGAEITTNADVFVSTPVVGPPPVPEPATIALLAAALLPLSVAAFRTARR